MRTAALAAAVTLARLAPAPAVGVPDDSDGRSYELQLDTAASLGLHGLALWRLGSTDPLP